MASTRKAKALEMMRQGKPWKEILKSDSGGGTYEALREHLASQEAAYVEANRRVEETAANLEELRLEIKSLEEEQGKLSSSIASHKNDEERLTQQVTALTTMLEEKTTKLNETNLRFDEVEERGATPSNLELLEQMDFIGEEDLEDRIKTAQRFRELRDETRSLETQLEQLRKDLSETQNSLDAARNSLDKINEEMEQHRREYNTQVEAALVLSEAEILPEHAKAIAETVKQISVEHGSPRSEALNKLAKDLEDYYDPAVGLEARLLNMKERLVCLEKNVEDLEQRKERHEKDNSGQLVAFKELRKLNKVDVSNVDIVEFSRILQENKLDAQKLRHEVKRLKGLPQAVDKIRGELTDLEARRRTLALEVETLENSRRKTSDLNDRMADVFVEKVGNLTQEMRDLIISLEDKVLSEKTGLKPRTVTLVTKTLGGIDSKLTAHEQAFQNTLDKLLKAVAEAERTVNRLNTNSYEAGKLVGGLTHLDSVTKLVQGRPLKAEEALVAVHSLTSALMEYTSRKGLNTCTVQLEAFLDEYRRGTSHARP